MTLSRSCACPASFVLGAVAAGGLLVAGGMAQQEAPPGVPAAPPAELAEAMRKAARFTQPGPPHRELERFLGDWTTTTRIFMGAEPIPEKASGTATFSWLMEGRWLKSEYTSELMGVPYKGFSIMGYDNFKQSFVATGVSSMDTAMTRMEGDLDPSGNVLILYGTLDEYLTGEHDKMVRYVYRFKGPDAFTLEVHDLPIGEHNTKVLEFEFTRARR